LPDRTVIDELVSAIDIMRNDVERLQMRLRKLEKSFAGEC
jgi:ubiquinone biosynthesis protein UbiJ